MEPVSKYVKQFLKDRSINGKGAHESYKQAVDQIKSDPEIVQFVKDHQSQLASDAVLRSIPKLREYLIVRDDLKSDKQPFAPGYIPQLVVSDHMIETSYAPSPETIAKQKSEQLARRVTTISMPKDIRNASLQNFDQSDQQRYDAFGRVVLFTDDYVKRQQFEPGYYIYGPFGVGKTYLLGALANDLADHNVLTTLVHFPSFESEMKASISDNSYLEKIDAVKKSQILMLDDIGAGTLSSWVRDEVLGVILEHRMQQQLPMFFSSNLSMDQLETEWLAHNNRGDEEPLKAKRLMQRIRFLSREVEMAGKNRRPM